ncbi:MAG: hypothetical protein GY787_18620 [Alteromonadales bacterium]|nr:hypothetical protein [Alteromonadales bacterium]
MFLFYLLYKTVNNAVLVTDKGLKFTYLNCKEYQNEIPWEHIDSISDGTWKHGTRFVKIDLKHDLIITKNSFLSFFSASAPKGYYLWNVYFLPELSTQIAEKINHVRMNRIRLAKSATNKAFKRN